MWRSAHQGSTTERHSEDRAPTASQISDGIWVVMYKVSREERPKYISDSLSLGNQTTMMTCHRPSNNRAGKPIQWGKYFHSTSPDREMHFRSWLDTILLSDYRSLVGGVFVRILGF